MAQNIIKVETFQSKDCGRIDSILIEMNGVKHYTCDVTLLDSETLRFGLSSTTLLENNQKELQLTEDMVTVGLKTKGEVTLNIVNEKPIKSFLTSWGYIDYRAKYTRSPKMIKQEQNKDREQTTYNKLVMYDEETKEGVILDYTFKHGDGFKGMTGTYFRVESKQEHRSYTSLRNIKEYLESAVAENERPMGLTAWAKECKAEDENFPYDSSANGHLEYIREELGLSEKECFFLSCSGGGRVFDKDSVFTHNKDLQHLVKEFEEK